MRTFPLPVGLRVRRSRVFPGWFILLGVPLILLSCSHDPMNPKPEVTRLVPSVIQPGLTSATIQVA